MDYQAFLERKAQLGGNFGFEPLWMPDFLFDFQRALVEWALRKGRGALLCDTGLGKTPMQLTWAENVRRKTGKPSLILTPLAVGAQTEAEAAKFKIEAGRSRDGKPAAGITITNYEQAEKFNPDDFGGVVCDESSAIKCFDGVRRTQVTQFMRKVEYRLLATATAAPNDYVELGTSSEALGELGHLDMLARFFKNDQGNVVKVQTQDMRTQRERAKWRFKGHAREHFWRWVCSWARAVRRPSDIGFDDARFILPPLEYCETIVKARRRAPGMLFELPAVGLHEEREEARRTIEERCEKVAELVDHDEPAVVWCHLNDEGTRLARLIPDAVEVSGSTSNDEKEESLLGFARGKFRVLVIKPKIGAWGMNWQHCAHMTFFPSHSFEQLYQSVRRCYRYGQRRPVRVDIVTTESGHGVMENLQRKAKQADEMFSALVRHMGDALKIARGIDHTKREDLPEWLLSTN